MSNFAPRAVFTPHHFEIAENARGYWVAKDKEGLIGGLFRTQKDAVRFALFEVAGDSTCVRVLPRTGPDAGGAARQGPTAQELVEEGKAGTVGRSRGRPHSALVARCSHIIALVFAFFMPRAAVPARKLIG
jgi:hypothetical protein